MGANQNAQKLQSTDLVNTNIVYVTIDCLLTDTFIRRRW